MSETGGGRTELSDLERTEEGPSARFSFQRDERLLARGQDRLEDLDRRAVLLAPDELHHPPVPVDAVVRLGKLRVSEFLADGREVTRAVLQAGSTFRTRPHAAQGEGAATGPAADEHDLDAVVVMALGEAEVWHLEAGALDALVPRKAPGAGAGANHDRSDP
jgi:hypothetical protein